MKATLVGLILVGVVGIGALLELKNAHESSSEVKLEQIPEHTCKPEESPIPCANEIRSAPTPSPFDRRREASAPIKAVETIVDYAEGLESLEERAKAFSDLSDEEINARIQQIEDEIEHFVAQDDSAGQSYAVLLHDVEALSYLKIDRQISAAEAERKKRGEEQVGK